MSYITSQDPTLERSFRGHKDVVTKLCFKPTMTQLASASLDYSVMIWNFKPQLRAFRFVGHQAGVLGLDFSPDGQILASSSKDKTIRLWTPNVKGDVSTFKAHTSSVRSVQFSHDGQQILSASDDKTIKLWATHRAKFQFTLAGHLNWVRCASFSPDARCVISGSDDKTIKLWDLSSKSCVKTYWDHTGMVSSVAYHPSGNLIASASSDRSIKVFDVRMHKLIQHYGDAHSPVHVPGQTLDAINPAGGVNSIQFGGDAGEWLISSGMDGLIKVWDAKEGHLFYTLHGHKGGPTTTAVFSPKSDFFATGGSDAQVMVWKSNFDEITRPNDYDPPMDRANVIHTEPGYCKSGLNPAPIPPSLASAGAHITHKNPHHASAGLVGASPEPYVNHIQHNSPPQQKQHHNHQRQKEEPKSFDLNETLSHILSQMDILTKTMGIIESRLTITEDRITDISKHFKAKSASSPGSPNSSKKGLRESPVGRIIEHKIDELGNASTWSDVVNATEGSHHSLNYTGHVDIYGN